MTAGLEKKTKLQQFYCRTESTPKPAGAQVKTGAYSHFLTAAKAQKKSLKTRRIPVLCSLHSSWIMP